MSARAFTRTAVLVVGGTLTLIGCSAVLGLGDLHDREATCGENCDAGNADVSTADRDLPQNDGSTDSGDAGDPCEFVKVTDPSVTGNADYAGWPVPNHDTVNVVKYTALGNGVVRDDVTKLEWQKTPSAMHNYGVDAGADFCASLPSDVAGQKWRVPTRIELVSIQLYKNILPEAGGLPEPCVDESVFDLGDPSYPPFFLTSTREPGGPRSWMVNQGVCGASAVDVGQWVRCVRGPVAVPDFMVSTKCNIVRDMNARLDWQRDSHALPAPIREGNKNNAENYCSSLASANPLMGAGWVMPKQNELYAMFDSSRVTPPLVSAVLFPSTPGSGKIISSTLKNDDIYGALQLASGEESGAFFSDGAVVRCVRHW